MDQEMFFVQPTGDRSRVTKPDDLWTPLLETVLHVVLRLQWTKSPSQVLFRSTLGSDRF